LELNDRVDLRFFSAHINDPLSPVDGEGSSLNFPCAANSAEGFNTASMVLPAAAPRNFLRVTLDIAFPFLGRQFCLSLLPTHREYLKKIETVKSCNCLAYLPVGPSWDLK
jgi:hypothetical protein